MPDYADHLRDYARALRDIQDDYHAALEAMRHRHIAEEDALNAERSRRRDAARRRFDAGLIDVDPLTAATDAFGAELRASTGDTR